MVFCYYRTFEPDTKDTFSWHPGGFCSNRERMGKRRLARLLAARPRHLTGRCAADASQSAAGGDVECFQVGASEGAVGDFVARDVDEG